MELVILQLDEKAITEGIKLLDYGAIGVLALILFTTIVLLIRYLHKLDDNHRKERKEWRDTAQINTNNILEVVKESSDSTKEMTNVMSGMKSLLESIDRRK